MNVLSQSLRFNYASVAVKDHVITGIEISFLKKSIRSLSIEYRKYWYRYFSTCIGHPCKGQKCQIWKCELGWFSLGQSQICNSVVWQPC